jgi:hypothetical protein
MTAFRRHGIVHLPANAAGWALTLLPLAWLATIFVAIDRNSHSSSDTLTLFFPYAGVTFLLWDWLARGLAAVPRTHG